MNLTFFIALNWNTTDLLRTMLASVEATTPEPHRWIILDNGSEPEQVCGLFGVVRDLAPRSLAGVDAGVMTRGSDSDYLIIKSRENLGLVKGHNLAFDAAQAAAGGEPFDVVMVDTDVEVYEQGWLTKALNWVADRPIGIVGMEHAEGEVCAGAVFLDPSGNWYLHPGQTHRPEPVKAESVGLGFALLRYPVPTLRFDTGFVMYYKQDDDLCFQARADLGLEVWAYPVACVHYGSGSLKAADYQVNEYRGWDAWDKMKRANQDYFAQKWKAWLKGRRPSLEAEVEHLRHMEAQRTG